MSLQTFRAVLGSKLGEVITPELAAWLEANAFDRADLSHDPLSFPAHSYRGLTFRVERVRDLGDELHALHQAHWAETEGYRHGLQMDPDYQGFADAERLGGLLQFTARDDAGRLVGNIRMYLFKSMHTRRLCAREDTFYLLPEARKGFAAIRFWQYMERSLELIAVQEIHTDSKLSNKVGRLNEYLGYTHVADLFHKILGERHVQ